MSYATIRHLIMDKAHDGTAIIDHLAKESGILRTGLAIPANEGVLHKHKKVISVASFSTVNPGASTTDQTIEQELTQTDLKIIRAMQSEPQDIVDNYKGGKAKFFRDQLFGFVEGFGQQASKQLIYGNNSVFGSVDAPLGFHQIAKANSKVIQMAGDSAYRTSIFAVKYNPAYCGILFNPNHGGAGKNRFLRIQPMNGGNVTAEVTNVSTGAKKLVYQFEYSGYLSFLSGTEYDVAAITQIQNADNDKPTAAGLDELVDMVKGTSQNTFLYASRLGRRLVRELKNSKLEMGVMEKNYDTRIDFWEGIPFVIDENISNVETTSLD